MSAGLKAAVEALRSEVAGYRVAAEIERGVMWSLAPYLERFHADDRAEHVTRMVREHSSSRSNEQRMTRLAEVTECVLSALSSQAEVMEAMAGALQEIAAIEAKPFEGGLDMDAIKACPECQRYTGHPVQHGICDTHRQPIWAREKHDAHEERALIYRAKPIARTALSQYHSLTGEKA